MTSFDGRKADFKHHGRKVPSKQFPVVITELSTPARRRVSVPSGLPHGLPPLRPVSSPPHAGRGRRAGNQRSELVSLLQDPFAYSLRYIDPAVDSFFATMEEDVERAFSDESPSSTVPSPSASEPPVHSSHPRVHRPEAPQKPRLARDSAQRPDPVRGRARRHSADATFRSPSAIEMQAEAQVPPVKMTPQILSALLDKMAPTPKPKPSVDTSPTSLSQGAGQTRLRSAIASNMSRVLDIFRDLDSDGSGDVDCGEFRKGIRTILGGDYETDDIDALFDSIDESGDGLVSYRELARTLRLRDNSSKGNLKRRSPVGASTASVRAALEQHEAVVRSPQEESSGASQRPGLHEIRQRETLRLFHEFRQQHADGVCKVTSFDKLLRLKYPTESKEHIKLMMELVIDHEGDLLRQAAEREEASRDTQELFAALDLNNNGKIDLDEFQNLRKITEVNKTRSELRSLFQSMDADRSGYLDFNEFQAVIRAANLLDHKEAIIKLGKEVLEKRKAKNKVELWKKVGVPSARTREQDDGGTLALRPSLVMLSNTLLNGRRAVVS